MRAVRQVALAAARKQQDQTLSEGGLGIMSGRKAVHAALLYVRVVHICSQLPFMIGPGPNGDSIRSDAIDAVRSRRSWPPTQSNGL